MTVATIAADSCPPGDRVEPALREARLCYDHITGRLGVAVCDMLVSRRHVVLVDGGGEVTPTGERFLAGVDIDLPKARSANRHYCRGCVDWTERRHHISGAVGAALVECSSPDASSRAFPIAGLSPSRRSAGRHWPQWAWLSTARPRPAPLCGLVLDARNSLAG